MKKLYVLTALAISSIAFAQAVKFSTETKAAYKNLVEEGIKNGLSQEEAIEKALENDGFKKIYIEDLKNANKKTSKEGIILSKNFIKLTSHKKVAILPFSTEIVSDKKKQSKKENIKKEEKTMDMIQEEMYKHFAKNQFNYFVEFQDIDRTNQILRSSGLWNNLSRTPTEDLAKALGVDAVIRGDYEQETKSKGTGTIATNALLTGGGSLLFGSSQKTKGELTLSIVDGKTGEVLWRKESAEKNDDTEKMMKYIMKSINKSFPYHNELVE